MPLLSCVRLCTVVDPWTGMESVTGKAYWERSIKVVWLVFFQAAGAVLVWKFPRMNSSSSKNWRPGGQCRITSSSSLSESESAMLILRDLVAVEPPRDSDFIYFLSIFSILTLEPITGATFGFRAALRY